MTHTLFPDNNPNARRKIKRPVISDADGMREGGLVFVIVLILGFIAATVAHPAAITSFWVWFFLIAMSVGVAVGVQKIVASIYGHSDDRDGEDT